jgi:MSHA biogenesis protein MshI
MANLITKFLRLKNDDEPRFCCIYIDKSGLSIALTDNRFSTGFITIDYLQYIPFEEAPTQELINFLLDQCVKEHNIKGVATSCILSRDLYRLILIDIPENVPKNELREATKWLIKDLIDFPMDNLASDVFLLPKFSQNDNNAYVCVAKKHMLKVRQQQIISSELALVEMSIIDLALAALTAQLPENQIHVLVSLLPSHSTLLLTMNHSLCLKHDIECTIDFSSENNQIKSLDTLPTQIGSFIKFFLAQLNQNYPVEIFVLPTGKYTEVIIDKIHSSLPYPVKQIDISKLFSFPPNTPQKDIDHCLVSLGGLWNKG